MVCRNAHSRMLLPLDKIDAQFRQDWKRRENRELWMIVLGLVQPFGHPARLYSVLLLVYNYSP